MLCVVLRQSPELRWKGGEEEKEDRRQPPAKSCKHTNRPQCQSDAATRTSTLLMEPELRTAEREKPVGEAELPAGGDDGEPRGEPPTLRQQRLRSAVTALLRTSGDLRFPRRCNFISHRLSSTLRPPPPHSSSGCRDDTGGLHSLGTIIPGAEEEKVVDGS